MAKKQRPPARRIVKWREMDPESRAATTEGFRQMGQARSRAAGVVEGLRAKEANPTAKAEYRKKSGMQAASLEAITPHLVDKPITMEGATRRRMGLVRDAESRAKEEGRQQVRGAGWYFEHHKQIMEHGSRHGFTPEQAITATTVLSAQNSPTTERKAGIALMDMVGNAEKHTVRLHPGAAEHVNKKLADMKQPPLPEHVAGGRQVKLSELGSHHIAAIGSVTASLRQKGMPVESTADFGSVGATRLSDEVHKSVQVLRGELHHDEAIAPSAQKISSYRDRTLASKPGSPEHYEYLTRTHHALHHPETPAPIRDTEGHMRTGTSSQGAFDLWGLRHAGGDHPTLGSRGQTVEDSWQQAISTGQKLHAEGRSPAKVITGIEGMAEPQKGWTKQPLGPGGPKLAPDISTPQAAHAYNVRATQGAAGRMPVSMGHVQADLPSGFVQETGWTEARIQAKADPEYRAEQEQGHRALNPGQFKGPSMLSAGGEVRQAAKPPKRFRSG